MPTPIEITEKVGGKVKGKEVLNKMREFKKRKKGWRKTKFRKGVRVDGRRVEY